MIIAGAFVAASVRPLRAQTAGSPQTAPPAAASAATPTPQTSQAAATTPACPPAQNGQKPANQPPPKNDPNRIFGVLPNYTSVDKCTAFEPLTTKATFVMTAQGAFDKVVYPFTAITAGISQLEDQSSSYGQGWEGYAKRYATSFADNTLATFMTTAILPTALHQDPRYFVRGHGNGWNRTGYALSRTVVTLSRTGHTQFNYSDIGGNGLAAGIMNFYHPKEDRSVPDTLNRWAMQVLFDGATNVLKEFWPDIRHHFRKSSGG